MIEKNKASKKKPKLRVVSTSPAVLSEGPELGAVEVTLRFEIEDAESYLGPDGLIEWVNGTFDNGDYSPEETGFPVGLGMPMVVGMRDAERNSPNAKGVKMSQKQEQAEKISIAQLASWINKNKLNGHLDLHQQLRLLRYCMSLINSPVLQRKDAPMLEKEIRQIAETAKKQHEGRYTTESDATVAIVLLRSLALAILGETLPPPVFDDRPIK